MISKVVSKYQSKFFESLEWKLVSEFRDLPEGEIHNKILFQLKLLAKQYEIPLDKFQTWLIELGYEESAEYPNDDYDYNPWTIFHWCMDNAEWCLKNKIIVEYPLNFKKFTSKQTNIKNNVYKIQNLKTFKDVTNFIKIYNNKTAYFETFIGNGHTEEYQELVIFTDELWEIIRISLLEYNKPLYDYIMFLTKEYNLKRKMTPRYSVLSGGTK